MKRKEEKEITLSRGRAGELQFPILKRSAPRHLKIPFGAADAEQALTHNECFFSLTHSDDFTQAAS